jgi:hypothetical protein
VPTATVCTDVFATLGAAESRPLGLPELPLVLVPHPIGSLKPEQVAALGAAAAPAVAGVLLVTST